jgi:hypothetical protein
LFLNLIRCLISAFLWVHPISSMLLLVTHTTLS